MVAAIPRRVLRLTPIVVVIVILLLLTLLDRRRPTEAEDVLQAEPWMSQECRDSYTGNASDIVVVLKTGTTEVSTKLVTQLRSALACVPNLLLMSDLEGDIAGHHLHDVLSSVNGSIQGAEGAFDIYRLQQRMRHEGNSLERIATLLLLDERDRNAAWMLDRYKFLHMLEKAWELRPAKAWYVFVEADTYLVWRNLLGWLRTMDPENELYLGVSETIGRVAFAYGGSGFVLSGAAMHRMVVDNAGLAGRWDERMAGECCGDYVLALALQELGLSVTNAWPVLSKEPPLHLPYGPKAWCEPVVTLHHVTSSVVEAMTSFEKQYAEISNRPPLFRDVFAHFIPEGLPSIRYEWDNRCPGNTSDINDGVGKDAGLSLEACSDACESSPGCFQYLFRDPECKLFKCFTYGKAVPQHQGRSWTSGWKQDRIAKWTAQHSDCPEPWAQT